MFSQVLSTSSSSFKFSKAANLFVISEALYWCIETQVTRLYTLDRTTSMLRFFLNVYICCLFVPLFLKQSARYIPTVSGFLSPTVIVSLLYVALLWMQTASGLIFPANYILILMILFGILIDDFLLTFCITFMFSYFCSICNWRRDFWFNSYYYYYYYYYY